MLESDLGNPHPQYFVTTGGVIIGKVEIRRPAGVTPVNQAWLEVNGLGGAALSLYRISITGVGRAVAIGVIHAEDNPDLCVMNENITAFRGIRASLYRIGDTIAISPSGNWVDVTKLPQIPAAKITPGNAPIGHILMVTGANTAAFSAPPDTSGGTAGVSSLNGKTGVVSLSAGNNISITADGNMITISSLSEGGGSVTWDNVTGKPVAFTPSAHGHVIDDILNLIQALNGKAAVSHSHAIDDLPVATSGVSNTTQVVRANDLRLSNARAPTTHAHLIDDVTNLQVALNAKATQAALLAATSFVFNFTAPSAVFKIGNFVEAREYTLGGSDDLFGAGITIAVSTTAAPGTYTVVTPVTTPTTIPSGARLKISITGSGATAADPGMLTIRRTG